MTKLEKLIHQTAIGLLLGGMVMSVFLVNL